MAAGVDGGRRTVDALREVDWRENRKSKIRADIEFITENFIVRIIDRYRANQQSVWVVSFVVLRD
ncbi:hypothetical protein B9K06_27415, partial [Bacillus sp. OG2]